MASISRRMMRITDLEAQGRIAAEAIRQRHLQNRPPRPKSTKGKRDKKKDPFALPKPQNRFLSFIHFLLPCIDLPQPVEKEYISGYTGRLQISASGASSIGVPSRPSISTRICLDEGNVLNNQCVTLSLVEKGEIVVGLGTIAELLRFPPSLDRPYWTLSFAAFQHHEGRERICWRRYFMDAAAFLYVIDSTDRYLMNLATQDILCIGNDQNIPGFYLLILLTNNTHKGSMSPEEVEEILGLPSIEKCVSFSVSPVFKKNPESFRNGLRWLLTQLEENYTEAPPIFPVQIQPRAHSRKHKNAPLESFTVEDEARWYNRKIAAAKEAKLQLEKEAEKEAKGENQEKEQKPLEQV